MFYWYNKDFPANVTFDHRFQAVLRSAPERVEYYVEYVESNRFPGEKQSLLLRNYLRQKYADRTIDVIVAVGDTPLNFLLKYRDDVFTHTPIVFDAIEPPTPEEVAGGAGLTGIIQGVGYKNILDLALRLQPRAERVFIISGTLNHDKTYEALCRNELQGYEGRISINYLTDFPLEALIFKVKSLPERSIVLYIWQQSQNERGEVLESADVLDSIAHSSSAPIYGVASWQLGRGIVGGYVRTFEATATRTAQIALRIADGARAQDIPVENAPTVPMFDWRELKRWGISEDLLPRSSVVLFKELSLWDTHKWQILGITSLCLFEAFLIFALLAQRAKRGLVEKELRESFRRTENLAGRLIDAQEEERKHIARELHDDLHQQVAALAIGLDLLGCQLSEADDRVRKKVMQLGEGTSRLSEWIRTMSHELHSSVLEHAGLAEALKLHCSTLREQQGIEVSLNLNCGMHSLPPDVALCLYRVAQEGLRNSAKHSGANTAQLTLAQNGESIELRLADQGKGFDPKALRRRGLGLLSMEERVRQLGGKLEVESEPGAGTDLRVYLPIKGRR